MLIIDERGERIENPDLDAGWLEHRTRDVVHRWKVDAEEVRHAVIVAEYPETGGAEVEFVTDAEEEGHWETRLAATGEEIAFSGSIPDELPHDVDVPDIEPYAVYRPYTAEEVAEIERAKAAAEEREAFLANAPARIGAAEAALDDADDALCALYEEGLARQAVADEQDAAICALYEMTLGGGA